MSIGEQLLVSPRFLIVGTPRSGTTLMQRLACEIPGVSVPYETHFFSAYARERAKLLTFPLTERPLIHELRIWAHLEPLRELAIDVDRIVARLDGRADSLWEMFAAVVQEMSRERGDDIIYGEKTPDHLIWAPRLLRAIRELKAIAVVRDPRAVIASTRKVPFRNESPVVLT